MLSRDGHVRADSNHSTQRGERENRVYLSCAELSPAAAFASCGLRRFTAEAIRSAYQKLPPDNERPNSVWTLFLYFLGLGNS